MGDSLFNYKARLSQTLTEARPGSMLVCAFNTEPSFDCVREREGRKKLEIPLFNLINLIFIAKLPNFIRLSYPSRFIDFSPCTNTTTSLVDFGARMRVESDGMLCVVCRRRNILRPRGELRCRAPFPRRGGMSGNVKIFV